MKPNDPNNYSREVQREVHTDPVTHTQNTTTRTTETVNGVNPAKKAAYHDGYVHGRVVENSQQAEVQRVRENDTAARGLLLGIILTSLIGLALGAVYYLNQRNEAPNPAVAPTTAPRAIEPSPAEAPIRSTERETTIIERAIPVPQPAAPQPSSPTNIDITVPNPSSQPAPAETKPAPITPPNINITVPNSVNQEAPTKTESDAQTSPASPTKAGDDASENNSSGGALVEPSGTSGAGAPANSGQ
ncbi:hypothetical protein [Microcoleus sp. FACHB-672]|uniref:hypothetical protein n=1 Tax=Microcoleus sp. FACHB-672 TaxID=2692825 RepID=UPI001686A677|nr:hypothetical protein [Microcoleus sp. FACHB-672]MBD2040665.1 hypothetical protein [Microcoleus sp. FACHB-672]